MRTHAQPVGQSANDLAAFTHLLLLLLLFVKDLESFFSLSSRLDAWVVLLMADKAPGACFICHTLLYAPFEAFGLSNCDSGHDEDTHPFFRLSQPATFVILIKWLLRRSDYMKGLVAIL